MLTQYPDAFPSESIKSLLTMIRDKNPDREAMGLAIWNIQGYAQSKILSNSTLRFSASSNPNPSDEDAITALTTLNENADNMKTQAKAGERGTEYMQANPVISIALSVLLKWALNRALSL